MPFSEKLKLSVRRRAAFMCCYCHETGVEIHHIIPQADGGADTDENAAPLCANCHARFGANPEKRKEIRQMRDWWYEVCEARFGGKGDATAKKLDELAREVRRQFASKEEGQKASAEIKRVLSTENWDGPTVASSRSRALTIRIEWKSASSELVRTEKRPRLLWFREPYLMGMNIVTEENLPARIAFASGEGTLTVQRFEDSGFVIDYDAPGVIELEVDVYW